MFPDDLKAAWDSHDGRKVAALFTENGVRHQFAFEEARYEGRHAIAAEVQAIVEGWPDCVLHIRKVSEASDGIVIVEWTFTGTHEREHKGLPAQGERLELHGVGVYHMEGDLISEERSYWDLATVLAAAGALG